MAKEKESVEPYVLNGTKLFETRKARDIIPLTVSADIGLGGGIPRGCTVLLGGRQKTGKTTVALEYARNAQELYGCKIFFANVEGRLDNKVLSQIKGLDLDKLEVIMGPAIYDPKDKTKVIGNKKMSSEAWWTAIGNIVTENPGSIIIVDSVSALSEEAELSEGMGHMSRGGLSKLEAQFMRQYGDLIVPNHITLFLLAQVQADTSGRGEPIVIKCGNAIRFAADCIMFVKWTEKWKPTTQSSRILGHDMHVQVLCSPLGPPYIETILPLRFGEGIDKALDLARTCIALGVIQTSGTWYILPFKEGDIEVFEISEDKDQREGLTKIQGEENLRNWLVQNTEHMNKLQKILKEKIFI